MCLETDIPLNQLKFEDKNVSAISAGNGQTIIRWQSIAGQTLLVKNKLSFKTALIEPVKLAMYHINY